MSTTTSITTTYAGESAGKYIAAALLPAPTLANNLITVKPNVKYKEVIKKVVSGTLLQNASCDFNPTGTVTMTERILQPKELQLNKQFCKSIFRNDWDAIQMGYSAFDQLPKSFVDFILAYYAEKVAAENEVNIWQGNAANSGQYDGFTRLLSLDAALPSAQELPLVGGGGLTASNVIAELGKVLDATPMQVSSKEDYHIYVSTNVFRLYVRALGGFATNLGAAGIDNKGSMWFNGGAILPFEGVKIAHVPGMPASTMIAGQKDNFYFGTGLLADQNEVKLIDMADIDGSQNVRVVMRMTGGVQYGIVEDIVTYNITNNAN